MPWTARYLPRGAEVQFAGHITIKDICDAQKELMAHPYDGPMRFNIADYSHADVEATTGDLIDLFDMQKEFLRSHPAYAIVMVAQKPLVRDLAQLWQLLARNTALDSTLVWDSEEAYRWLRERGYLE